MSTIQGLRDMDGFAVEFLKIAPGGFVVVDIDGQQHLISRQRWDALPAWGTIANDNRARRQGAWSIALIGIILMTCDAIAWVIERGTRAFTNHPLRSSR